METFLQNNSQWIKHQQLISKLSNTPMYFEIFTKDHRVIKLILFEGQIFSGNEIGKLFASKRYFHAIYPEDLSEFDNKLMERYVKLGLLIPRYESHPYYKLKTPAIVGYKFSQKLIDINDVINASSTELLFETDLQVD